MSSIPISVFDRLQVRGRTGRRCRVLAGRLQGLLPRDAHVANIGDGDPRLARAIMAARPDLTIISMDLSRWEDTDTSAPPTGRRSLPIADASVDVVLLADVLHHADHPMQLLAEAARVARHAIIIKDYVQAGWVDRQSLSFIDWARSAPLGMVRPGSYWSAQEWTLALQRIGAAIETWETDLGLYPWPLSVLLDRSLHFVARVGAGSALRPT
jgi:SAM-dependent methyltransferase